LLPFRKKQLFPLMHCHTSSALLLAIAAKLARMMACDRTFAPYFARFSSAALKKRGGGCGGERRTDRADLGQEGSEHALQHEA
jgi:hypothetical protein